MHGHPDDKELERLLEDYEDDADIDELVEIPRESLENYLQRKAREVRDKKK